MFTRERHLQRRIAYVLEVICVGTILVFFVRIIVNTGAVGTFLLILQSIGTIVSIITLINIIYQFSKFDRHRCIWIHQVLFFSVVLSFSFPAS